MRKLKLPIFMVSVFMITMFMNTFAQTTATGLFFSEYIEGSGNNKALEIFNGTGSTADLSNYVIRGNYNGNTWNEVYNFPAGATIADGDVYVIANSSADPAILAVADTSYAYGSPYYIAAFNGDDVRALCYLIAADTTATDTIAADTVIIDIIGAYDMVDPGSGWDVAGVTAATANHTLVRKDDNMVTGGNTDWAASAGTDADNSEWMVFNQDEFSYLGTHNFLSSNKEILSFTVANQVGDEVIDDANFTVDIEVMYDSTLTLTPVVAVSDLATYSPTTEQDFSSPVTYTVTAEDGTTQDYVVTITNVGPATGFEILDMGNVANLVGDMRWDDYGHRIEADVMYDSTLTLSPTFDVSDYASISPASGSEQDFSGNLGVTYTVTSQDGNTLEWRVIIENIAASMEANMESDPVHDSIVDMEELSDTSMIVYVTLGTDLATFNPTFDISWAATVSPASGSAQDFSSGGVTYTITAQDGVTSQEYVLFAEFEDVTAPTITAAAVTVGNFNDSVMVVGSEEGTAYLVLASDSTEVTSTYVESDTAFISVDNIESGTYHVYMEDTWGNVSAHTTDAIVVTEDTIIVSSIAELWEMMDYDNVLFTDTSEAFVTFTQSFRNQKWVQDGTAGILIDDSDGVIPDTASKATNYYAWGDGVTGLTGHLTVYKDVLEFVPTAIPTLSSTGNEIVPVEVTLDELNSTDYQSQLVVINNVTFDAADGSATFSGGNNYDIYNGETWGTFRTNFYDADYVGEVIPEDGQNITGIAGQYYSTAQIYARATSDFEAVADPVLFVNTDAVDFGSVIFGETSYGELHAMNIGGGDLTVTSAYIVGDNAFIFDDAPFVNQVIDDMYFDFTFAPAQLGNFAATFVIEYNDGQVSEVALTGSAAQLPTYGMPYETSFEELLEGTGPFPPEGWTTDNFDYFYNGAYAHSGDLSAYMSSGSGQLISAGIEVTGIAPAISFWQMQFFNYNGTEEVAISTDMENWTTVLVTSDGPEQYYEEVVIPLEDYIGQTVYIGFFYANNGGGNNYWFIDDFKAAELPNTPIFMSNADAIDFGSVDVGTTAEFDLQLTNAGISFYTVTDVSLSGTDAAEFSLVHNNTYPWEVGASDYGLYLNKNMASILVSFSPTTIADGKEALITVNYTDPRTGDHVVEIPLSGNAISCANALTATVGENTAPYAPSWFDYTPATDELVTVSSCKAGQFADTDLGIYDACDGNMVAANDDNSDDCADGFIYSSTVTFAAKAGVTYKIHWIDTWDASGFTFTIAAEPLNVAPTLLSVNSQAIDAEIAHTTLTWEEAPQINPLTKNGKLVSTKAAIKIKDNSLMFVTNKDKSKCDDTLTPVGISEDEPNSAFGDESDWDPFTIGTEESPAELTGYFQGTDNEDGSDAFVFELTGSAYVHVTVDFTCGDGELWVVNTDFSGFASHIVGEGTGEEVNTDLFTPGTYIILFRKASQWDAVDAVEGLGYVYNVKAWITQPPKFHIYKDNFEIAYDNMAFAYTDEEGQIGVNSCYTVTQELYDGTESGHSNEMCITPVATEGTICDMAVEAFEGMNWSPGADYWFKFTPESAGIATMTSCLEENTDINPDTRFFIYEDCNIPEPGVEGGNEIAFSEDDGCEFTADGYTSTLSWTVNAGQTYIIMMDDYWDNRGFWFDISTAPIAEGEICESAIPLDLPVVAESGNTEGYGDDYDALSCNDTYITGDDKCYSINIDKAGTISGDITGTYAGLYIIKGLPGDDQCIAFAGGATEGSFTDEPIDAGQYFVIVSSWEPTQTTDFVFNLTFTPYDLVDVTFNVDMNVQIHLGNFDPAVDSVDVVTDATYWEYMGNMTDTDSDGIYSYTVSGLTVGDMLKYKYRMNADWATAEFSDDIYSNREYTPVVGTNATDDLFDDAPIPTSSVTFIVNMNRYIALGYFDPNNSALDIAGSFNGWDGTGYELDGDGFGTFTITVSGLEVGTEIEYKFRMNGTWDGTEEFPNGGANRTYTIKAYDSEVSVWYNDIVIKTDEVNALSSFSVYPNPNKGLFNVTLNSETPVDYTIELMNVQGQIVYSNVINNVTKYVNAIDVSELAKGVYYLKVNENFEKVIVE